MKRGKKYQEAVKKYDRAKLYTVSEAASLVKELSFAKFDETVELHIKLMLKKSQSVRDTVVLPNQFSAEKKILVFAKGDKAQEALDAGAAYVGDNDLIEKIRGGWMDFDVAVATPDMMKDVGRLGPILGRRESTPAGMKRLSIILRAPKSVSMVVRFTPPTLRVSGRLNPICLA